MMRSFWLFASEEVQLENQIKYWPDEGKFIKRVRTAIDVT